MYCDKCGADNSDTAVFCRKCGVRFEEPEQETRVASRRGDEPEEETRVASRRVDEISAAVPQFREDAATPVYQPPPAVHDPLPVEQRPGSVPHTGHGADEAEIFSISPTLKFVKAGYALTAVAALLLVALTSAFLGQYVPVSLSVVIGLLLFLVPAFYHVKQKLVKYTLTDSKLEIDSGLISRTTCSVPIRRIQDVTVASGITQRLLGFGDVVIDNASEEGGKLILKNIDTPKQYADILLKQLRHLDR